MPFQFDGQNNNTINTLGLVPMVTGVSFDFRNLAISWVSESSQWWRSMAIVVIFGLMVATFLTLLLVDPLRPVQ